MAPHSTLVHHSQDPHPLWRDPAELFRQCEDIILFLASTTPVILDSTLALVHPIVWRPPNVAITLVELFGGWPYGQTICLCGQLSSIRPCSSSSSSLVDGVVPTIITPDCHSWVFFTSPS